MVRIFAFFLLAQNFALNGAELKDVRGKSWQPLSSDGYKAAVLFFITHDCPIANKMAPEIKRITKKYAREIKFTLVYTDPEMTHAEVLEHMKSYGYEGQVAIHDREHQLVRATRATITPQAAVLTDKRRVVYLGRINNFYADFGKPRRVITQHELRDALDAVLAGKKVVRSRTEAVGCFITPLGKIKN